MAIEGQLIYIYIYSRQLQGILESKLHHTRTKNERGWSVCVVGLGVVWGWWCVGGGRGGGGDGGAIFGIRYLGTAREAGTDHFHEEAEEVHGRVGEEDEDEGPEVVAPEEHRDRDDHERR